MTAPTMTTAPLEVLLTDAAGDSARFVRPVATAKLAAGLARHPQRAVRRAGALGAELTRVAAGRSTVAPGKRDRRFADPAWERNPLIHRVLQTYLAAGAAVDGLIDDAEVDWRVERNARFAAQNVLDAIAPSNFPLTNPTVLKALVDEGGMNLVRGLRRFLADFPGLPATVDDSQFGVGENLAVTPGSVIYRDDVFELLEYAPATETVRAVPLLFVPPTINKFYVLDLAPGRSMIEYLVGHGQRVFAISWRNPTDAQGHFDYDTYAAAILQARDVVSEVTEQPAVHINAACSGGIIGAGALAHLAAEDRLADVASLTLLVCALDSAQAGTASALASRELAAVAVADSARRGYLDGQALAGVFTWLRPNDMVWNYVVNNYLLGKEPPAFDVLYWNQDTVRLAAGVHRDFVKIGLDNALARPGALITLGTPVDLSAVTVDSYIVAGLTDHIIPWENAYRSTQLLGGDTRFVLSTSGHVQAMVNPPSADGRATYRIAGEHPAEPEAWLERTALEPGSWWSDYGGWLGERSGEHLAAPATLGSPTHKPTAKAPGSYVHAN
jgi:polyhydroxyalkanoate synthase subunit PhaC